MICYVAAHPLATDFCNLACLKCLFIIIITVITVKTYWTSYRQTNLQSLHWLILQDNFLHTAKTYHKISTLLLM